MDPIAIVVWGTFINLLLFCISGGMCLGVYQRMKVLAMALDETRAVAMHLRLRGKAR